MMMIGIVYYFDGIELAGFNCCSVPYSETFINCKRVNG